MACYWTQEDYFSQLMCTDKRAHSALEMLVDDLHAEKERTISTFLCHSGSEDFLWGLVRLLGNENSRVAGNSAYIIGTLAESDLGCYRILALAKGRGSESRRILHDLTQMLTFDDSESVMNAAGTMGTLAESHEGREWILSEDCLDQTLNHITALLHTENLWTASNAALVLARLCISEDGCNKILQHKNSQHILSKLVLALGVDEAGRGMNAAFAIGRLCDMDIGRRRLLGLGESEKMITSLARMLSCDDTGASKNACFALSCLATNTEGHSRLLHNVHAEEVLKTLSELLSAEDCETGWFAAMTLRTLASQPKGCLKLRENGFVISALKVAEVKTDMNADLKEEVIATQEILKRLEKPPAPKVEVIGCEKLVVTWDKISTKSGLEVFYQVFEGNRCMYQGRDTQCEIHDLEPCTHYNVKMRAFTEGDDSPFSDVVSVLTEETVPGPPVNVRILGLTTSQLKVGWDPPDFPNGALKGYYIYQGERLVEHTTDLSSIISGLAASTSYEIQVCASNAKGRGERASVIGTTAEIGAHAPSKPHVNVLGRNEVHVSWQAPEVPLGRITKYELLMNGKVMYSGMDLSHNVRRLTPDSDYTFIVVVFTNEGKFESKATKKRTSKDEYDSNRPPLYQPPPPRKDSLTVPTEEAPHKSATHRKKKSGAEGKGSRTPSAKGPSKTPRSGSTDIASARPISASSSVDVPTANPPPHRPSLVEEEGPLQKPKSSKRTEVDGKKENIRPSSKTRVRETSSRISSSSTTREGAGTVDRSRVVCKSEKSSASTKSMFPVSVSYVSIQAGDDAFGMELDATGRADLGKKPLIRTATMLESNMRLDRSRTTFSTGNKAKNQRLAKLELDAAYDRQILSGDPRILNSWPGSPDKVQSNGSASTQHTPLPKPAPPNQAYLEGRHPLSSAEVEPWASRSLPSPRKLDVALPEPEFLEARRLRRYSSPVGNTTAAKFLPVPSGDNTYCIESQQAFLQRTNTFVSSHRPAMKRSLERMPSKLGMPMGPGFGGGGVMTFAPEIPESRAAPKFSNKFIPMQLRTQPNNLSPGQLQRVNTTLLESRGFGNGPQVLPGRRLESLSRSHTQVEMKQPPPQRRVPPTPTQLPPSGSMELLGMASQPPLARENSRTHSRTSGPRRLNPSMHIKEPDSALLGQSWATYTTQEELQSAR